MEPYVDPFWTAINFYPYLWYNHIPELFFPHSREGCPRDRVLASSFKVVNVG